MSRGIKSDYSARSSLKGTVSNLVNGGWWKWGSERNLAGSAMQLPRSPICELGSLLFEREMQVISLNSLFFPAALLTQLLPQALHLLSARPIPETLERYFWTT
eukprot:2767165-Pleurochrysis_carterae.AAC.4